jgi:hypothetical protein
MDHIYQLRVLGSPDQPMLEAYTALGSRATATNRIQLRALVTGDTSRTIAEQVKAKAIDAGLDGVIINMPFYRPGVIAVAAEALRPIVGS